MVFEFSIGGYFSTHNYTVKLNGEVLHVADKEYSEYAASEREVSVVNDDDWARLLTFLKDCKWESAYSNGTLDGTEWELKVKGNGCKVKSYGIQTFPDNFDIFISLLNQVISPSGVVIQY